MPTFPILYVTRKTSSYCPQKTRTLCDVAQTNNTINFTCKNTRMIYDHDNYIRLCKHD